MNGEQFFAILYSNPPSLPTSSPSLSSTSPLLPCCSSNWWLEVWRKQGGGLKAGQMICSLPVEAYVALQCWGGYECGSRSYAGNVSLCSARAGPEKPTTLFKEMAVRGPSTNSLPLYFSVCLSLGSKRPFLPCTRMIIIFLCGKKVYIHTCWEEGEHTRRHTHTQQCIVVFCVIISGTFVSLTGMCLSKLHQSCGLPNNQNNNKPAKRGKV